MAYRYTRNAICLKQLMKCINPKTINIKINKYKSLLKKHYPVENFWNGQNIEVGCGKCYFCRRRYATTWARRCELETIAQNELGNNNNWFLTLTFENQPIKNKNLKNYLYGITTKFIEKLRNKNRYWKNGKRKRKWMKYVWVSELGEKNGRAHIHMLIWNFKFNDLEFYKLSQTNNIMYVSNQLLKLWKHGIATIQELTKANAAYLYKYEAKNYLQKCQSGGIGLTFFYTHLDDVLNEKSCQNRYFLKKYRQLIGDQDYLDWLKFELKQKFRFIKKKSNFEHEQRVLKLKDWLASKNSKITKARDF